MRPFHFFVFLLMLGFSNPAAAGNAPAAEKPAIMAPDFCRMFGTVFLEYEPARKAGCQYTIFIEEEEAFANVIVYKEDNKLFADAPGLWHVAAGRNFSDYIFFVTTNRNMADFTVHFTDVRSFAGCKK